MRLIFSSIKKMLQPIVPREMVRSGIRGETALWEDIMNKLFAVLLATTVMTGAVAAQDTYIVGVSWNNFQEERWKTDEAAIRAVLDEAGASYISADAQSSASKQLTDIESLIAQGADALIILAQDSDAIGPAVASAVAEGIPVVGYDRLIENPDAFYLTFDNKEVGRMQAQGVFDVAPEGNYVFIKGNSADPNADFLFAGQMEVLQSAIDSGAIANVGEAYTDNWNPEVAQANMEQFLTANNNEVDAVVASNDGTAGGAIAALAAQGLAGSVPVSGQDGDHAALNRIALGTQTVSVWKDARELGKRAAEIALELAGGAELDGVTGATKFSDGPNGVEMNAVLLPPVPITQDNLDVVIDAGWVSKDVVCQGVTAGSVAACD
ncbi:D-xylose transport system substrate-binding protein [Devosia crocina]|uniref:D-xylose transport system substrate-binding protein n=2 Tax=Devosia crocina TaxID=429728 RepID=A0A1I7NBZ8_9HYPH|nr:D-xylose transport system substrate-binding protein [Devosia crocina]